MTEMKAFFYFQFQYLKNKINGLLSAFRISAKRAVHCSVIVLPVPPLPVQDEIVRILDKFTELEKELEMRKKQYEYYRDQLLTFKREK